jgi:predicted regulator of Ras-like GTPase activity (Roadblock/LC7/MglB family)
MDNSDPVTNLSQGDLLESLLEVGGVLGAAFVRPTGEIVESRTVDQDFTEVEASLGGLFTSNRLLSELLGAENASQTRLEFSAGTLLLTRVTPLTNLAVVALTSAEDADRVRFGLRRLLSQLAADPSEPDGPEPEAE